MDSDVQSFYDFLDSRILSQRYLLNRKTRVLASISQSVFKPARRRRRSCHAL
jgi:hypothetical protein